MEIDHTSVQQTNNEVPQNDVKSKFSPPYFEGEDEDVELWNYELGNKAPKT